MAGQPVGMTPAEGRALAAQLDRSASALDQILSRLTNGLDNTGWAGNDRNAFESELRSQHTAAVRGATGRLRTAAGDVRRAALAQERVSGR